jgi:dTDP-4-amino-4,6-dideoxygalactose transaminase
MADRRKYRIRFQAPEIPPPDAVDHYFRESRESQWFSNRGPCHELLEHRLAAELGGGVTVVPVANATAGLMVSIRSLTAEANGRRLVIVPSYTFVATVSAILWSGFEPLFVDVDPHSWHLDPEAIDTAAEQYDGQVALIMGCSTFGTTQSGQVLDALRSTSRRIDAPLLVDSAAGFGSRLPDGAHRGCDGDLDVYSFHATKPFAIGEGGLVVSPEVERGAQVAELTNFGFDPRHLVGDEVGLNAKLDEWHCATALAVLDTFAEVLTRRQDASNFVKSELAQHGFVAQAGSELASSQFVAVLAPNSAIRDECLQISRSRGIEFRDYYRHPLHTLDALRHYPTAGDLGTTADLAQRALSLPLSNHISEADLDEIIKVCIEASRTSHG